MRLRSISNVFVSLASATPTVAASPGLHKHGHNHFDKRHVQIVDVPGPTVIAYELNGKLIDQSEVCAGIDAGTLKWADGTGTPPECSSGPEPVSGSVEGPSTTVTPTASITADVESVIDPSNTPTNTAVHEAVQNNVKDVAKASPTPKSQQPSASMSTSITSQGSASCVTSDTLNGQGLYVQFPDGEVDCTTFPSEYGPIHIEWAGLGGWSGIQYVTIKGNQVTHIDTAIPGGDGCKPGAMCSYACPPGYQKSQWPSQQGSTGQSVGGLSCNAHGKLALTNPELSKYLCIEGTGAVTVQNKLSNNAAICRTDYPGTESEVVPLNTEPHSTSPLTCPDASTYFHHNGDPTTAQYYINNQGVALQSACTWGTDGTDMGNWAPSFLGVGQDMKGKTWLSISTTIQNNPISYTPLNFTVKIEGDVSGNCALKNGKYCSGENYEHCNERGCTVELMSGQATYVLAESLAS